MKTQLLTALFIAYGFCLFAQIKGIVKDRESSLPVFGAIIISSEQSNTTSNEQGAFSFNVDKFPVTLITIAKGYPNDTIVVQSTTSDLVILLGTVVKTMDAVVVSAGRRSQKVEEVAISMLSDLSINIVI